MALTVQNIVDDANNICRHQMADPGVSVAGTPLTIMIPWVDAIHQDVLHTSPVWATYMYTSETFESAVDGSPYTFAWNDMRRIVNVYDTVGKRFLIPYHDLNWATGTGIPTEKNGPPRFKQDQTQQTNAPYPQYYIIENCINEEDGSGVQGITLFPDPRDASYAGTIRVYYQKVVPVLDSETDILLIPDDGKDVMVAGVAMHLSTFLKRPTDTTWWRDQYERMKMTGNV